MTDHELADFVGHPPAGMFRVSMSKEGIYLTAGGTTREINSDQAAILFDLMSPELSGLPFESGHE